MPWYIFIGPTFPETVLDPCDHTQYLLNGDGSTPPACFGSTVLCAIQAYDIGGTPWITPQVCCEIAIAQVNRTSTTNVLLRDLH